MRITKLSRDSDCLSGRSFFLCFCTKTYDTDFIQKKHKMFIKWNMKWICVRVAYVMVIQFGFVLVCCVYVCAFNGNAFFNEKDFQEFHFCFCHRKVLFNWNEMKNSHFINEVFSLARKSYHFSSPLFDATNEYICSRSIFFQIFAERINFIWRKKKTHWRPQ